MNAVSNKLYGLNFYLMCLYGQWSLFSPEFLVRTLDDALVINYTHTLIQKQPIYKKGKI